MFSLENGQISPVQFLHAPMAHPPGQLVLVLLLFSRHAQPSCCYWRICRCAVHSVESIWRHGQGSCEQGVSGAGQVPRAHAAALPALSHPPSRGGGPSGGEGLDVLEHLLSGLWGRGVHAPERGLTLLYRLKDFSSSQMNSEAVLVK